MYPKDAEGTPGPASAHQISEAGDDGGLADAAGPPVLQPVVSDGRYRGEFERGHWHGKGLLVHLNGDIYDGHFHYDVKHGAGTYVVAATGSVFVGEWVNGEPECCNTGPSRGPAGMRAPFKQLKNAQKSLKIK